ncbi:Neuropilin-2 [Trichinella pseudospiralis]|uniref:Neuropilin-2 n=3 Tax=Trichinella pseudospiralis TaxID=6337 RepID=A0A0V1FFX0_TRIPS|nr:Neuropilin-2 [Trichinella pseudospiralis]KRZ23059.1 Neuropilin-2 [Trichinella pseudospiralis]
MLLLFWLTSTAMLASCHSTTTEQCPSKASPLILTATKYRHFLTTPGFVGKRQYSPNLSCHWIIRASRPENKVQLFVHESQIEDRLFGVCDDFIEVLDGGNSLATPIVKWCGQSNPTSIISSTDRLYIHFKSDSYYQEVGANMSYIEQYCPAGWTSFKGLNRCYRMQSSPQQYSWPEAQKHCIYDRSNLLVLTSQDEYHAVVSLFASSGEQPWVGLTDLNGQNIGKSINDQLTVWPEKFSIESKFSQLNCLYLDFNLTYGIYDVDHCFSRHAFICEKKLDGTTIPYPIPPSLFGQVQANHRNSSVNSILTWVVLALIIFIIIITAVVLCYIHFKKKSRKNRISDLVNCASLELKDMKTKNTMTNSLLSVPLQTVNAVLSESKVSSARVEEKSKSEVAKQAVKECETQTMSKVEQNLIVDSDTQTEQSKTLHPNMVDNDVLLTANLLMNANQNLDVQLPDNQFIIPKISPLILNVEKSATK